MKLLITMAGVGARFRNAGYDVPKPLISVLGRTVWEWAFESVRAIPSSMAAFVIRDEDEERYAIAQNIRKVAGPRTRVFIQQGRLNGQLCSALVAKEILDDEEDLLIASADTYVASSLGADIADRPAMCRGLISVADLPGDRWSFARVDASGWVVEVAEKKRIARHASTGLYYFSSSREFLEASEQTIAGGNMIGGEHYIMPVYDYYLRRGWKVGISIAHTVGDMGTPEALDSFVNLLKNHLRAAPD